MKVTVDDNCIGCGACVAVAPKIFKLENGKSVVIKQPTKEEEEVVQEAAESCPTQAIHIE